MGARKQERKCARASLAMESRLALVLDDSSAVFSAPLVRFRDAVGTPQQSLVAKNLSGTLAKASQILSGAVVEP